MNLKRNFLAVAILFLIAFDAHFASALERGKSDAPQAARVDANKSAVESKVDAPLACSVKIDGAISSAQVYVARRAVRAANAKGAKLLILDMNTPWGDMASTLDIMEVVGNFNGVTACYVNPDAISAGSFIAIACDKIFFSPKGVMGAAETVTSAGGDIDESMQRKLTSFLAAKVRTYSGENSRRAQVQRAMNDPDFELSIGGRIVKKKGALLTLTAKEAVEEYDSSPLLADGISHSVAEVAKKVLGDGASVEELKTTWAEEASKFITQISPILLGIGFFLIIMEVKSGGFGVLACAGVGILLFVFAGAHLAGIAGYEAIVVFVLGVILVVIEFIFFPGIFFVAGFGGLLMLMSIAWALGDIRPVREFDYNLAAFGSGMGKVALGIVIALALLIALWKFLPQTRFWNRLVLERTADAGAEALSSAIDAAPKAGDIGVCVSDMNPAGRVDFGGKIVDASAEFGCIGRGEKVKIVAKKDFYFTVKKV